MIKKITRKNLERFLERYRSEARILDVGSGGSSYDRYFPNRITVDIDSARKPEIIADINNLPFLDNEFELVLCTEVLEHVLNPESAAREMGRVLKPGGTLILTTRFVYPLHDIPGDYWRFTKYGLRNLFKEWDIVELKPETRSFSTIAVLLQRMVFQGRYRFDKIVKVALLLLSSLFDKLNFLIVGEYGDIKKSLLESDIMPSGYYLVAKKKQLF